MLCFLLLTCNTHTALARVSVLPSFSCCHVFVIFSDKVYLTSLHFDLSFSCPVLGLFLRKSTVLTLDAELVLASVLVSVVGLLAFFWLFHATLPRAPASHSGSFPSLNHRILPGGSENAPVTAVAASGAVLAQLIQLQPHPHSSAGV